MDYIINSYREIAFRMSVRSAADPNYDLTGEIGVRLPDTMRKEFRTYTMAPKYSMPLIVRPLPLQL